MNLFTRFFCWPGARAHGDAQTSANALVDAPRNATRETNRERAEAAILRLQRETAMFDARINNVDNEICSLDGQIRGAVKANNLEHAKRLLRKRNIRKAQGEDFFRMQCNLESMLMTTQGMNIKMDVLETFDMVAQVKNTDNTKVEELMTSLSEKISNGDELNQILNQPLQTELFESQDDAALLEELTREYGYGVVDNDYDNNDNGDSCSDTVPQRDMPLQHRRSQIAPRVSCTANSDLDGFAVEVAGDMGARQPKVKAERSKVLLHG